MRDAQKGLLTRPQAKLKPEAYPLGYVEDFDKPRTKLGAFFSIPLRRAADADMLPPIRWRRGIGFHGRLL